MKSCQFQNVDLSLRSGQDMRILKTVYFNQLLLNLSPNYNKAGKNPDFQIPESAYSRVNPASSPSAELVPAHSLNAPGSVTFLPVIL